jgi:histidyl-tRNA synthetase
LDILSVSYSYSKNLVRGLDYYDKIVFEFVSSLNLGAQNTFCAGGRYNHLAQLLGSKKEYPSIGAGIGIERLMLMIMDKFSKKSENIVTVIPLSNQQNELALLISDELSNNNIQNDIIIDDSLSIKNRFKLADKLNTRFAIIIGEDEIKKHSVKLKDMLSLDKDNEILVKQNELVNFIKSKL